MGALLIDNQAVAASGAVVVPAQNRELVISIVGHDIEIDFTGQPAHHFKSWDTGHGHRIELGDLSGGTGTTLNMTVGQHSVTIVVFPMPTASAGTAHVVTYTAI